MVRGLIRSATTHRPFWLLLAFWAVGSVVVCLVGPHAIAALWGVSSDFPMGSLVSLACAWLTFLLSLLGLINIGRLVFGYAPYDLRIPPDLTPWLARLVPVAIGILIGVTIFT
jgi:hypothetical protein